MPATDKLIAGYKKFRDTYYKEHKDVLLKLAKDGQSPKIAIISCCDSRVDPTVILSCDPGDLFVIRNVANLVPPCEESINFHGTSAALEFAVTGLGVESIIVLGHANCGGIRALIDNPDHSKPKSFIAAWMRQLENVRNAIFKDTSLTSQEQRYHACEKQAISQSLKNLMTFPWIASRVKDKALFLHGWYYDLNTAELLSLQTDNETFQKIS